MHQVENILQVAIIEDKKLKLKKEPLNVHDIIEQIVIGHDIINGNNKIEARLEAPHHIISGDKTHFTNLIKNLVDNAVKYSNELPQLSIKTYNDGKGMFIEIQDKGIGIPKEHLQRIFRKFYRVPTGNLHNVKGFGLGLNYVKNITKQFSGSISVQSEVNVGTTFKLYFPTINES